MTYRKNSDETIESVNEKSGVTIPPQIEAQGQKVQENSIGSSTANRLLSLFWIRFQRTKADSDNLNMEKDMDGYKNIFRLSLGGYGIRMSLFDDCQTTSHDVAESQTTSNISIIDSKESDSQKIGLLECRFKATVICNWRS